MLNETSRTGNKEEAKLVSLCLRIALSHVRHQEDADWFIFFEPIQATAAQWPKDMHQDRIDEWSKMNPLRRRCYMVVKRRTVEKVQEDAQGGAKVAPKRKGKRRQKAVSRGSESESGAGEDPAGERRSSRQVKLEDQKSNEKQEQNNAPTCAGDSGRRTLQSREFGNFCDVFTVGMCFQHFFRGPTGDCG